MKPDATYTQANQLIKLFRDLGIVEAIKDGGKSEFGMAKFKFIKNDLFNHIATSFSKVTRQAPEMALFCFRYKATSAHYGRFFSSDPVIPAKEKRPQWRFCVIR